MDFSPCGVSVVLLIETLVSLLELRFRGCCFCFWEVLLWRTWRIRIWTMVSVKFFNDFGGFTFGCGFCFLFVLFYFILFS